MSETTVSISPGLNHDCTLAARTHHRGDGKPTALCWSASILMTKKKMHRRTSSMQYSSLSVPLNSIGMCG